jgi:hypothetical protein
MCNCLFVTIFKKCPGNHLHYFWTNFKYVGARTVIRIGQFPARFLNKRRNYVSSFKKRSVLHMPTRVDITFNFVGNVTFVPVKQLHSRVTNYNRQKASV